MHKATLATFATLSILAACTTEKADTAPPAESAVIVRDAVVPYRMDRAQLAEWRWLEGHWRGTGSNVPAFYERYSFPTDSTMVSVSYRDSTMTSIADSSIYVLSDGQFAKTGDGPLWVLGAMGGDSLRFEPLARASNSFTWRRVSADEWTAILGPAGGGNAAPAIVYTMKRVK